MIRISLLLLICLISTQALFAQSLKEKKADRLYDQLAYKKAASLYEELILNGNNTERITKRLADAYRLMLEWDNAEHWYSVVVEGANAKPIDYYYYAQALKANEKYEQALSWMDKYAKLEQGDLRVKDNLQKKGSLKELLAGSDGVIIKNLDINSKEADFGTSFLKNNLIVFSSSRKSAKGVQYTYAWNDRPFLDLYIANKNATGDLVNALPFSEELNSRYHEGPVVFNQRGSVIYFTRNNYFEKKVGKSKKDVNNLKIFKATKVGEKWGQIESLHFNSDEYSCGHPTLSANGKLLFFASDMPGGYGGTDIYVCEKKGKYWGTPINLGDSINTEGNEMFPFLHKDGTLYFSSDGLFGLGGLDIFMATAKDSTLLQFNIPKNIAKPLNSSRDDFAFTISENNTDGYFSSNREGGHGDDDIYYFQLNTPFAPDSIETSLTSTTTTTPELSARTNSPDSLYTNNLDSLSVGQSAVLENIYYDLDKWNIRHDAERDLKKVINYLHTYPTAKLELSSHTDSRAPDEYNMELSRKRAMSAVYYIVINGKVSPERLVAKGYGETKLTNECADDVKCSEAKHQANRRTEVKLLSK